MKQIDIREGARRQHRTAALFAVIQCWLRDLDGLVFNRNHLERLLGLERFKTTRIEWLQEDLKEFFPHQEVFWITGKENSFHSLFISRIPLKGSLPTGTMTTEKRITGIPKGGPRISIFKMWAKPNAEKILPAFQAAAPFFADAANYDERLLSSYLALLSSGQTSPLSLPPLEDEG
ncbi:hypothetical protein [Jeongeupia chitinilytica]|uniref:Uncharacterized protein n=1 Tax=Jeongeupia chitinilytica TaxID=1041641 RepID=A0ABQ3H0K8_9NEIS|nr:hypothetical protein [Jeongeupia chitinilytica]GHD60414.1 hypothetical protein GCM10007350_13410 [Jeongeupia chitinilytica]